MVSIYFYHFSGNVINVMIYRDTAGQEKYHALAPMYYRGASAAVVVYDVTDRDSFEGAKRWISELQKQTGKDIIIGLAGNKVDLHSKRKVLTNEGSQLAKDKSCIFFETSAKVATNIKDIFTKIGMIQCPYSIFCPQCNINDTQTILNKQPRD